MVIRLFIFLNILWIGIIAQADPLPNGFVYLKEIDPSILQDMRYAGFHNFIGRPIQGYEASTCILSKEAASALHRVQMELQQSALSLKVYDCYRPQMAVDDFIAWAKIPSQQTMKAEFYPRVNKADVFQLGYVAEKSGHTRGGTVDLTIVAMPIKPQATFHKTQALVSCFDTYKVRYPDNSIDMGTGFDCFDVAAHGDNQNVGTVAFWNRQLLHAIMNKYGFDAYPEEWWHFTLVHEPYPNTYFNFKVV